jgi:hypothetical protein
MTARHAGYVVTLNENVRDDDAEDVITALRMVKGVLTVEPVEGDSVMAMAEARAKHEITMRVYDALTENGENDG